MSLQTVEIDLSRELSQWFDGLITRFRLEASELSDDQRKRLPNTNNYLEPCQVEVFWLEQPEYQTIISSNFADRPDKEIIINGPYKGYEFIDKVDAVLREPRWTKPLPGTAPYVVVSNRNTLADVMYGVIANQLRQITASVFTNIGGPGPAGGQILTNESWAGLFIGNIAKTNPSVMVEQILTAARMQAQPTVEQAPSQPPAEVQEIHATIGYLYPPITIGSMPEPQSLREFLNPGIHFFSMMKTVVEGTVGGEHIVFTKDGLMAVTTIKKQVAVRIFNIVSALILLEGSVAAQAIRESEIGHGTLDPATLELRGWGISGSVTPRTMLLQERMYRRLSFFQDPRQSISENILSEIIEKAHKILDHPKKADELILWLESNTHFQDGEFASSFVISWILVERDLSTSWESFLRERNVRGYRKNKLVNSGMWPADSVLETLNLAGILAEKEYSILMELKSKRNSFVHEGSTITKDDALECLDLATTIMKHDLEGLL